LEEQIVELNDNLKSTESECHQKDILQKEMKEEYNSVQQELEEKRKNIVSTDKTISNLMKEKEKKD